MSPAIITWENKPFLVQNLSLEKPKKPKSGKIWGHSRTLSRVEALGMVRMVCNLHFLKKKDTINKIAKCSCSIWHIVHLGFWIHTLSQHIGFMKSQFFSNILGPFSNLIQSLFVGLLNRWVTISTWDNFMLKNVWMFFSHTLQQTS